MSREQTLGFQVLRWEIENILSFAHLCQARGCCEGRWDDLLFYNHMLSASTLVHLYNQQHNSRIWHWLQSWTFIVDVCLDQMYFKVYHLVLPPEVSPQSLSKDSTLMCVSVTKPFFSVFQDPGIVGSARTPPLQYRSLVNGVVINIPTTLPSWLPSLCSLLQAQHMVDTLNTLIKIENINCRIYTLYTHICHTALYHTRSYIPHASKLKHKVGIHCLLQGFQSVEMSEGLKCQLDSVQTFIWISSPSAADPSFPRSKSALMRETQRNTHHSSLSNCEL